MLEFLELGVSLGAERAVGIAEIPARAHTGAVSLSVPPGSGLPDDSVLFLKLVVQSPGYVIRNPFPRRNSIWIRLDPCVSL
jgi:hypothetical protein